MRVVDTYSVKKQVVIGTVDLGVIAAVEQKMFAEVHGGYVEAGREVPVEDMRP